jgi:hypothetical protein
VVAEPVVIVHQHLPVIMVAVALADSLILRTYFYPHLQ